MNGTVIPGTPIAVDFWKIRECPTAKLFFLTHLHGDHTVGLSSSWRHVIHCSPMTGELLTHLYGINESLIQPLEVGTSHILDLDSVNCEKMSVTVIDANHCPGSVMFLFEGYFGRILHTGDFRFCDELIDESNKMLFNDIDLLYLDNTYCSPQCAFPSRDSALDEIVSVINSHPHHSVVIGMRNLGKEDMLAKTALRCKEWISIPATMMQRVNLLNLPNVFVTDDESCRIRVVRFHTISKRNMALWNKVTPTIAILPTALYQGMDFNSFGNMSNVFIVQYSDHSSYQELYNFVSEVKPRKIIPVVGAKARGPFGVDISDRANMKCFSHLLNKSDNLDKMSDIPESVQKLMHNGSSSHGNGGGGRLTKPWKFRHKKSSTSLERGVVFSGNDNNEECERIEDHQLSTKISHTVTNIRSNSSNSNKRKKKKNSETLDSNINSQSPLSHKMEQKSYRPQVKETLLDKWLSVNDVWKKEGNPHHQLNRPYFSKTSSRNCFISKTQSAEKPRNECSITSSNSQEVANDTSSKTFILEVKQDADIEDVIILDDTSSDSTH
ncbi:5' exonuclease Apollo [Mizuhopecten yessoensis]|uniref:5' exonuclease Apollo n=2 Tax=Mizuhopecten yessoensis TaxID=6573 RepID=A0A210PG89_MIZYE|nr:5' exonuclease Apollo [Mizuhopecten yessoensis]